MNAEGFPVDLTCPSCSAVERCGYAEMLARLRAIGVLRRSADPEPALVRELFGSAVDRFPCSCCGLIGLCVRERQGDDWDNWGEAVLCKGCRQPIPRERLETFPETTLCVPCQQQRDLGTDVEPEFCPRCGDIMSVRLKRGTSRYVMSCPRCGSR